MTRKKRFKLLLDKFCKEHDIDEMTFSIKGSSDEPNDVFHYINLDDYEFQFYQEGDTPINYESKIEIKRYYGTRNNYTVITWPDVQLLFEFEGFRDNSVLITEDPLYTRFGDSAYLVDTDWLENLTKTCSNKLIL